MKKIVLTVAAVMAFGFAAQAQEEEIKFGIKAGANFSNFDSDDSDGKTGFYVGALADLPVSGNFHVQGELLYSSEGADDANLDYLRIPVLAKYYVMQGLSVQVGPEFGFKIGGDDFVDDVTKSFDFGIGAGVGYELSMGLFFDARYNLGLSNISDVDGGDFKNTNFQIGAGYRF
jgi:opacity protein-like surface antigen